MVTKENYSLSIWENHTIVSLWVMLKFYAHDFIYQIRTIDLLSNVKATNDRGKINLFSWAKKEIYPLKESLEKYGLSLSVITANKIIDLLKTNIKEETLLQTLLHELIGRVHDELSSRHIFLLDSEHVKLYDTLFLGNEVIDTFPDSIDDIAEAGRCYALGRYTASVFHLMRIMEKTVQYYANKLGIGETITCDSEWQKILNLIRGRINTQHPNSKDQERIKHESMINHFETIKIAWRNPTMHPKATYTEEEARALITEVEILLKDMVKIL